MLHGTFTEELKTSNRYTLRCVVQNAAILVLSAVPSSAAFDVCVDSLARPARPLRFRLLYGADEGLGRQAPILGHNGWSDTRRSDRHLHGTVFYSLRTDSSPKYSLNQLLHFARTSYILAVSDPFRYQRLRLRPVQNGAGRRLYETTGSGGGDERRRTANAERVKHWSNDWY